MTMINCLLMTQTTLVTNWRKKGQINVKRGLNSVEKPGNQFNYNTTFKINGKIIYEIFTEIICSLQYDTLITENWDV